ALRGGVRAPQAPSGPALLATRLRPRRSQVSVTSIQRYSIGAGASAHAVSGVWAGSSYTSRQTGYRPCPRPSTTRPPSLFSPTVTPSPALAYHTEPGGDLRPRHRGGKGTTSRDRRYQRRPA